VVTNTDAGEGPAGESHASGGSTPSARSTHPSPTRPDNDTAATADAPPDPNWFDASGLGDLYGAVSGTDPVPAGGSPELALTDSASPLPSRDHSSSPSSAVLLGLSLLIMLALAGGAAYRWWDHRPDR
jgi:hypothetical protein